MSELQIYTTTKANELLARHSSALLRREVENVLIVSLLERLVSGSFVCPEAEFAAVERDGEPMLFAVRTPPYYQILSSPGDEVEGRSLAVAEIAEYLAAKAPELNGFLAPKTTLALLGPHWRRLTGRTFETVMNERIHQLAKVEPALLAPSPRRFRAATAADADLLTDFAAAFVAEVGDPTSQGQPRERRARAVATATAEGRLFVLEENARILSCAQMSGSTPNVRLINFVFTPKEHRGKGAATECVARLSQRLLDEGATYCALFTDLANQTSSGIYFKIGYRPVIDVDMVRTVAAT